MSDELKPCPFCGKPGLIRREGDHHGEWFNLGCVADVTSERPCPGACPWYTSDLEILADAIAAWNRRADAPLPDNVRAAVGRLRPIVDDPGFHRYAKALPIIPDLRLILTHLQEQP